MFVVNLINRFSDELTKGLLRTDNLTDKSTDTSGQFGLTIWLTKMGEASDQRLYRGPKRVSRGEAFAGGR